MSNLSPASASGPRLPASAWAKSPVGLASIAGGVVVVAGLLWAANSHSPAHGPAKPTPAMIDAAKAFDARPRLSPDKSTAARTRWFAGADQARRARTACSAPPAQRDPACIPGESYGMIMNPVVFDSLPGDQLDMLGSVYLAQMQPDDAMAIARRDLEQTHEVGGPIDIDLEKFVQTGAIPAPEARNGEGWRLQVERASAIAESNARASAPPLVTGLTMSYIGLVALLLASVAFAVGVRRSKLPLIPRLYLWRFGWMVVGLLATRAGALGLPFALPTVAYFGGWLLAFAGFCFGVQVFFDKRDGLGAPVGRAPTLPPIWPPRRPDDWGKDIQMAHMRAMKAHGRASEAHRAMGISAGAPVAPIMPLIPSWEEHHAAEQARDPLQIRWAQSETGEWVRVVWGNRTLPPANGAALPVYQSVCRADSGVWTWMLLGSNVPLDWQSGPPRTERVMADVGEAAPVQVLRPLGHAAYAPPPAPTAPDGEHGSSEWQTTEAMRERGNVRRDD